VTPHIGTLNEQPLHAALKAWYAGADDRVEVRVDGYVIDLVRGDLLIEIQTRNVSAIKRKLAALVESHPVRLVCPIAAEKWIVRLDDDESVLGRRKSPRRGMLADIFAELVHIPGLMHHPGFSLDVLLIQEEELRRHDPRRGWRRRGWITHQRRLLAVTGSHPFATPADLAALLPDGLAEPFTTADLAAALGRPRRLAQQMAYTLRESGAIVTDGKRRGAWLYRRGGGFD
jgi:hypothetical protein